MSRRSGGRKSKVAIRSAPLAEKNKPVHPGELGGHYKPFEDDDMEAVVENIYRILEEIGFNQATPHCVKACTEYGAIMGSDGRLRMPREIVIKAIDSSNRQLTLHGQDPSNDIEISGSRVYFATGGAAVMNSGDNLMYFARKEQCLALGTQLRSFKPRIEDYKIYRIFPGGDTEFLHPKDGVFPEKVNEGRPQVGHNPRRIGENPNPASLKFTGRSTYE